MPQARLQRPHPPNRDEPDGSVPGAPPVEPDQGPVPPFEPDGPGPGDPLDQVAGKSPRRSKAPQSANGLAMPHERDESAPATAVVPDPVIVQAKRDLDAGMVDTDMRATPGLDAQRRASLVPGQASPPKPLPSSRPLTSTALNDVPPAGHPSQPTPS